MVRAERNVERKARTHQAIIRAANELFGAQGYAATSMEQIAATADVAIRTIYLHFDSKAAILLAFHDLWLDEFIRLVGDRSVDERLDDAVARALATMAGDFGDTDKRVDEVSTLHPVIEFIADGSPEIAGHIMQRWALALDTLAERFRVTQGLPRGDAGPRVEAAAVFAAWLTTILDFRTRYAGGVAGDSSHDIGRFAIRSFVDGLGSLAGSRIAAAGDARDAG